MADAKRDNNQVTTLLAVSNVDGVTPVVLWADPTTHRLLVSATVGAFDDLTDVTITSVEQGDIIYYNGSAWVNLHHGTAGQFLKTGGNAANPSWDTPTISGFTFTALATGFSIAAGTTSKTLTVDETKSLSDKENVANKSTDISADAASNVKYPGVKAIKDYVDSLVVGLLDYRGAYDASVNTFPESGGSGTAGAILKGDLFVISVAGTLGGEAVQIGDYIIANEDTPGQTASKWDKLNTNVSYVPEDVANKVTSISGSSTDTQYPSAKCLYDNLQAYITKALFDANTILYANSDNTPAALTVGEQTVVGRITGGNIAALTVAQLQTLLFSAALPENVSIPLDPAGSADGKYSGITITGVAGATVAFGDLITLDKDDSRWELVDISVAAAATGDARGILGMAVSAGNDGDTIRILLEGIIRADSNFPALTIGAPVYASTTGDIVVAQPTTTDYVIRIVGSALTADEIFFRPDFHYTTHT